MSTTNCLNCGQPLTTTDRFCSQCGQKGDTHRLKWHDIWHDAVHYFTHADKGIFHLLRELAIRPGLVAREFMAGRRKTYFKPLNFFLIVAGILVFISTRFHRMDDTRADRLEQYALHQVKSPQEKAHYLGMVKRMRQVTRFTTKYANGIQMLATPLVAFIIWLFYSRGKYNYVEHLVANMFFVPFVMLIYSLIVLPLANLFNDRIPEYTFLYAFFFIEFIYRSFAYYHFINKKGTWPLIKAFGVILFTVAIWVYGNVQLISSYIRTGW